MRTPCWFICCCLIVLAASAVLPAAFAQPFTVQGTGVNPNNFRVTIFASGLDFPLGMVQLGDGSLLVALSQGANFNSSTGKLVRFTDTNQDGIADGPGTTLYTGTPGSQTDLRIGGNLVFVTGDGRAMSVLRTGATPVSPLTLAGQIIVNYPNAWEHKNSGLAMRNTPGQTNSFDLVFQVGSESNFSVTARTVSLTNSNIPGASGVQLPGDAVYMLTVIDHGTSLSATNLTQIASGLRNAAGFAFHPTTGDLYLQDNGIDGLIDGNEPLSADELNFIARTNLGGAPKFFGYPSNYTVYRTGALAGGAGIQPLMVFEPLPDPFTGHESEGVNNLTFAPPGFPAGLNTGIFLGFHGKFSLAGTNNEENAVVYADPMTGAYFHFIEDQLPGVGHLDGLLATRDSLFLADLVSTGNLSSGAGAGIIYQIKSLVTPIPPVLGTTKAGSQLVLTWDRGILQAADTINGPWGQVVDAFSPQPIPMTGLGKFYRVVY